MHENSTVSKPIVKKLNLIQVFRGLAAVAVILCHINPIFKQNYNGNGFLGGVLDCGAGGVDLFFVISGFIIFYMHRSDFGNPGKLKPFLLKRFIRIYPLYWLVLGLKLAASSVAGYDANTASRGFMEVLNAFLLLPQQGENFVASGFLGVSWTLMFEVFFYGIFAFAISVRPKIAKPIVAVWLVSCFLRLVGIIPTPKGNLYLDVVTHSLNLEFAMGCFAAYLVTQQRQILPPKLMISAGLGLYALFGISFNFYHDFLAIRAATFGIAAFLLVSGAVTLEQHRPITVPPVLATLGDASYSIYLMHGFFISNLSKVAMKVIPGLVSSPLMLTLVGFCISGIAIVFGCFVYFWVEKPLLSMTRKWLLPPRVQGNLGVG